MADDRTYIRVHDGIEDHPKTAALSDKAFRLLVTTWAWCSRHRTDGRVPLPVWKQRGTAKARDELVKARLVDITSDAAVMHDYLEHQRSAEQIAEKVEAKRKAGALGNHNRWHVGKRYDPTCPICVANGSHMRSQPGSQNVSQRDRKTSPETETETETETDDVETLGGEGHLGNASDSRPPARCDQHADHPAPPPCRACGDARLAAEAFDRQQARAAVEARTTDARQRAEDRARAITACPMCDTDGRIGRQLCDHDPTAAERAARGREAVRAALGRAEAS